MSNKIDGLLNMFVGSMEYTPKLSKPVTDGDKIIATNGYMLLVAPTSLFALKYDAITEKFPDYKRVIPEHKDNALFYTDGKFIYDEAMLLMHIDEYTKCEECEGHGELYTISHKSVECRDCGGTGNDEFLGNLIPLPDRMNKRDHKSFLFYVNGVPYNPNALESISKIAIALDMPMKWVQCGEGVAALIYIGDVLILLMPMKWGIDEEDEYKGELYKTHIPITSD